MKNMKTLAVADPDAVMSMVARLERLDSPDHVLACAHTALTERTTQVEMNMILAARIIAKDWS